jgi:hypothetical protein
MRFGQPVTAVEQRRVPMKPPIHSRKASYRQHDGKYQKNDATPGETAQALSSRRRFNPGVHQ